MTNKARLPNDILKYYGLRMQIKQRYVPLIEDKNRSVLIKSPEASTVLPHYKRVAIFTASLIYLEQMRFIFRRSHKSLMKQKTWLLTHELVLKMCPLLQDCS